MEQTLLLHISSYFSILLIFLFPLVFLILSSHLNPFNLN